jgi:hypothetical protein
MLPLLGMCLMGCLGVEDEVLYEDETWGPGRGRPGGARDAPAAELDLQLSMQQLPWREGVRGSPGLGASQCRDVPAIEGTTKVPSNILGTTTGWSSTSCPNCQWQVDRFTTTFVVGGSRPFAAQATNDANVNKTVSLSPEYEWDGEAVLRIWDPTDASVGTCILTVPLHLSGGFPF